MSAPFPSAPVVSPSGGKVAWIYNARGVRNIWVAEPPEYRGHGVTAYTADDGQEISELAWTPGPWDMRISANYTGKRYYTNTNDASVPSFWIMNAEAAYDFGKLGSVVQDLKLALNVTNLLDKRYFATIGSNGFVASDPTGAFQTLLPGSPRATMLTATVRF